MRNDFPILYCHIDIILSLWVRNPPVVCFFSVFFVCVFFFNVSLPKRLKFNHVDIYIFKVKKKSTRTRCEKSPKLIIKVPKRR